MDYYKFLIKNNLQSNDGLMASLHRAGFGFVKNVKKYLIFCLLGELSEEEKTALSDFLFCDKIVETCEVKKSPEKPCEKCANSFNLEVMLKPGVTDTQSREAMMGIKEMGFKDVREIVSGTGYTIEGNCNETEKEKLAKFLCNELVQYYAFDFAVPQFTSIQRLEVLEKAKIVEEYDIANMSDEELLAFSNEQSAALDLLEMQKIRDYYKSKKRKCTDAEFEMIAQTWSEHCVHKTFKSQVKIESDDENVKKNYPGLEVNNVLKTYIKKATDEINTDWVVSAFVDNAGIVTFNNKYDISFKVETHNHPSAIEPFGGANTGVGGVIRDVMGVSARPFAVTDVLCFGDPNMSYEKVPAGSMHPNEIISGVISGVSDYGNKMGIPTVNGGIHFSSGYTTNPLVYCGCAGISPKGVHSTSPQVGDHIYTVGAPTGRDAIRGATFSSMIVDASTGSVAGATVQTGDPITQKKVCELLEAVSKQKLYSAITDCGAGGFSSAVGEMASKLGCDVDLTKTPVKYEGLAAWELWVSESQERMVLAVPAKNVADFEKQCKFYDVEFFDLGHFTGDGILKIHHNGKTVINLDCDFLHSGPPQKKLIAKPYKIEKKYKTCTETKLDKMLLELLGDLNICSREKVVRLYDYEVQGGTILRPYDGRTYEGPMDAAVVQPREVDGKLCVALSNALHFKASEFGTYAMTQATIDEAVRSVIAVGADPKRIGILDNYCLGDPNRTEVMWDLIESARACYDTAKLFSTPFISGKDSFNNEYLTAEGKRVAIPTSLLISAMAIVPSIDVVPGADLKKAGNLLYLLGESDFQFGASVFAEKFGLPKNTECKFTTMSKKNVQTYERLHKAISDGLIASCHDISDGGLLVALAEMCIGGDLGAKVDTKKLIADTGKSELQALFGETCGCFVVEISAKNKDAFEKALAGTSLIRLGAVTSERCLEVDATSVALQDMRNSFTEARF
ncbi:MAG: phosphoribosylformylglycinamidine synthase subunit PurL [Treponemataceae bacterium]